MISSESAISAYEEPDNVAEQQRHLQVWIQRSDGPPNRIDQLDTLRRRIDRLELGRVVERVRLWPPILRAQLVEDAVLRNLEEPRREPAAQRERRQAVIHPNEDFLRQVLGQSALANHAQHIVEHGYLVGVDDRAESALIAVLSLLENRGIRLRQRHGQKLKRV